MAMAFAELLNAEALELEAAGADVIQFDEPAFNVFMDDVQAWGIDTLNRAVAGLKCTKAVHICYGYGIEENIRWKETLGDEWRQYDAIFPALNKSNVDQVSLECASSHVPLSVMRHLSDKQLMVGAVAVTADHIETPEEVAATIKAALGVRRCGTHPALHQLRHDAHRLRHCACEVAGTDRRCGAGEEKPAGGLTPESAVQPGLAVGILTRLALVRPDYGPMNKSEIANALLALLLICGVLPAAAQNMSFLRKSPIA